MPRFLNTPSHRKEDGSMLSEADLAAQTAFAAALPLLIDSPMLGEEMSVQEQTTLWKLHAHTDGLWVVDPIDGTNNFVNGLPHFAVSVAFVKTAAPNSASSTTPSAANVSTLNAAKAHTSTAHHCPCAPSTKNSEKPSQASKSNTCVPANSPAA